MAKQTPGSKCDAGSKYELSVTALFTSLLSKNKNVEDYRIFSNLDEAQPFDDVVVDVHFKGVERSHIYAIQIKSGKDKLNINKYYDGYNKIMGKQGLKFGESNRNDRIHFWYYCNKCPTKKTFTIATNDNTIDLKLRPRSRPYNLYESILDKTVSYELFSEDTNMIDDEQFLNRFYLFLNQPNTEKVINIVRGMWSIDNPGLILLYLDNYFAKSENGLDKATFEHEMLKLSLCDYVVTPTRAVALPHKAVHEWNRLTLQQDVTILCNETNIEQYLFGCILQNISDIISIDEWNRCVDSIGKIDRDVKIRLNVKLFKPETLKDLIIQIWIDGKAPLPLKVDTPLSLLKKFSHLKKSYIIIDSEVDKRYNEMKGYELRVFRDLGDVESDKIMKEIPVSLQGRKAVSLHEIIKGDRKLMQTVTCLHIINLIKPREVYLKRECLERNDYMFFIIETKNPQLCSNTEKRPSGANIAVYCELGGSYNYYNKIRANPRFKSYKIFRLRLIDDNKLTLVPPMENLSTAQYEEQHRGLECFFIDRNGENVYMENGDIFPTIGEVPIHVRWRYIPRHLRQCIKEDNKSLNESISDEFNTEHSGKLLTEKDFFKESSSKLTVITGDPGMGKTTLLHSLFGFCESEYYVLFINLACHQVDLHGGKLKSFQHLIDLTLDKCNSLLYHSFLNNLYDYPNRLVLILDSFDEIVATCKEQILAFLTNLLQVGLQKIIVASRLTVVDLLTENFEVEMFKIEGIYDQFDEHYIDNWNLNISTLRHIPSEFLTNPLYLNMLRTISESEANLEILDRWSLYECVVKLKIEDYCKRICLDENEKQYILRKHSELALKIMFGINKITQKLEQDVQSNYSNFIRLGFIIRYNNENPVFIHHTFVEFFVVKWLIKNVGHEDGQYIYRLMLNNYKSDVLDIHCDMFPLHKAILDKDLKNVEHLCRNNPGSLLKTDELGRSVLHLAAIHFVGQGLRILDFLIQQMRKEGFDIYLHDKIMNWTWIDYFEKYGFQEYWPRCKVAIQEAYINYYATNTEKLEQCKFSISGQFNECYSTAIYHSSVNLLRVLLYLKYHNNKDFIEFRELCLHSHVETRRELLLNMYLPKEKLKGLHLACIYGNLEIVRMYINSGAHFNEADKFNCTPVHYGVMAEQRNEIIKVLLKNCEISKLYVAQFNNFTTLLHMCVRTGDIDVTKMVLQQVDAYLEHKRGHAFTLAAIKACVAGYHCTTLETTKALLKKRDKRMYTPLELAIKFRNRDMVEMLLQYDADVNFRGRRHRSPLCAAVRKQNGRIVELLLQHGADPNYMKDGLISPLIVAVESEDTHIAQMLLHHNADVNYEDEYDGTPLCHAITTSRTTSIKLLLRKGANVNYVNRSGTTPLTYAIYLNCSKDIVQILLNYKADVNLKDRNDETPLSMAINTKNFLMIELLLQNGAYVDPMTLNIWISDICANKIDNKSTAQMLLRNLTDCVDAYGFSSLIIAVETGKTTIAKMLLKNNANVNFKTEYGFTALYVAAFKRNVDMVELLLEHGADVNIITSAEEILHNAKKAKKIEIVVRLLKNRTVYHFSSIFNDSNKPNSATNIIRRVSENWADLNLLKELRTAVKEGVVNLSTIAALKQWGGDIDIADEFWTAVFCICDEMDDEMIDCVLLRNLGRNKRDCLVRSACSIPSDSRNLDLINILSRCLVSCTNFLRIAIELNDRELVQIALENPAAVKLTDSKNTPLCIAVRQQNVDIVRMLLEHNCPVNQVDGYGFLPLMIAIRTENLAIVEMLLANGADANYEAEGPRVSPLYIAALAENRPLVNILLKYGAKGKIRKSRLKKHGDSISTYQDMKEVKRIIEEESNKLRR